MLNQIKSTDVRRLLLISAIALFSLSPGQNAVADPADKIYQDSCAFCHSRPIPPFTGPELRGRGLQPDYIKTLIRRGSKGMLTFTKADISDAELDTLAKWLQASQAPTERGLK